MILLALSMLGGCAAQPKPQTSDHIILVPGAGGDGSWYTGLRAAMARDNTDTDTMSWGAPLPLYMLNLQDPGIHAAAERKLATRVASWKSRHPDGHLFLIGHSAGCGVTLGALARLDPAIQVDCVLLLAPSVSPQYDLAPATRHITGSVHVFFSQRDDLWLNWRTSTFGTYDNVQTRAAGHDGFASIDRLAPELAHKVVQHPHEEQWAALGNDGGHWGTLARPFADQVLAPLLTTCSSSSRR